MSLLDALEKRIGRFAIPGLIRYVVMLNALVFVLLILSPAFLGALTLDPEKILQGQVWRLVSWIFIPPNLSPIWLLFALMLLWIYGEHLEQTWGTFRLNLFYFTGMLGCTAAAFIAGGGEAYNALLNLSVFFAFATVHPNFQLMLFFILPVKVKWLALLALVLLIPTFLTGTWATRAALIVTFTNYFLFFGPEFFRKTAHSRQVATRRAKFQAAKAPADTLHRCAACGRTEVSNPDLDFRVAADGHEYCTEHLAS